MVSGYIFGIGLGRTGSLSLCRALDQLSITNTHYPNDSTKQQLITNQRNFPALRQNQALVDGLAPFYPHLYRCFSDAVFILTVRDLDSYVASRLQMKDFLNTLRPKMSPLHQKFNACLEMHAFGAIDPSEEQIRQGYIKHEKEVRHFFRDRKMDLLVIDIPGGDGWEVLCPFLSCNIPQTPFPKANSTRHITIMTKNIQAMWDDVNSIVGDKSRALLIDDDSLGLHFTECNVAPFPNRAGVWWGLPIDSSAAVAELRSPKYQGVDYVIFAWTSFWWLDFYNDFYIYLLDISETIVSNSHCIILKLFRDSSSALNS